MVTVTYQEAYQLIALAPGYCTDRLVGDAEGIWGKQCSNDGCWYQLWKIGPGSFTTYDGYLSPIPPGRVLYLTGSGYGSRWLSSVPSGWPVPSLTACCDDVDPGGAMDA